MIELKNISKSYNNQILFDNVSFKFNNNGFYLIGGESGIGKTTLLNILSGLDFNYTGNVIYNSVTQTNKNINDLRRNEYGFIFQEINLIPELNVYDNIVLSLHLKSEKIIKEKVIEILRKVRLEGYEKKKINELSGGEKQRVAIARALIKEPKVVFADEPTGMLDKENALIIYEILKEISQNRLVVMVSHDVETAKSFSDYYIQIINKNIVCDRISYNDNPTESVNKKVKKSHLSFLFFIKLGITYLKIKPIMFIFSILLSIFSIAFLGISFSISSYNGIDYESNIILSSNYDTFALHKNKSNGNSIYQTVIDNDSLLKFNNDLNSNFKGVKMIYNCDINFSEEINYLENYNAVITNSLAGLSYISQSMIDDNGYILYGRLPENVDEIVITEYFYQSFLELGYVDSYNNVIKTPSKDEILNKNITLSYSLVSNDSKNYKICGILDTKFNYEKYSEFLNYEKNKKYDTALYNELNSYKQCSIHSIAYVTKQEYESFNKFDFIIDYMPKNIDKLKQYIYYFSNSNDYMYTFVLPTSYWFNNVDSMSNIIKNICLIVGIVFLIFSMILLITIFNNLIAHKNKDIGIMRAFGAKTKSIIEIFMIEALILFIISIVSSSIISPIVLDIINKNINFDYYLIAKPFNFRIINFIELVCVEFICCTISLILPLVKILKRNTIEIINKID